MCWCSISQQYPWLRCLAIFLDNATSTNKNHYLFAWAMEMVRNDELEHVHISFMIADHTKFTPDRLFSNWQCIQSSWCIHNPWATSTVCSNSWHLCRRWKACSDRHVLLGIKYSDLPGVHKLHDFLIVRQHNGEIVMKVYGSTVSLEHGRSHLFMLFNLIFRECLPPHTRRKHVTHQPRKWLTWSRCMIVSSHLIRVPTTFG